MNSKISEVALLFFAAWIVIAFGLAQRKLNNFYSKYQKEDEE